MLDIKNLHAKVEERDRKEADIERREREIQDHKRFVERFSEHQQRTGQHDDGQRAVPADSGGAGRRRTGSGRHPFAAGGRARGTSLAGAQTGQRWRDIVQRRTSGRGRPG